MAWLARDDDNTLIVYATLPMRDFGCWILDSKNTYLVIPKWMEDIMLKGRIVTWYDEPVEIS